MNKGTYIAAVPVDGSATLCYGVHIGKAGADRVRVQLMNPDQPGEPGEIKLCRYTGASVISTRGVGKAVGKLIRKVNDSLNPSGAKCDAMSRRVAGGYGTGKRR